MAFDRFVFDEVGLARQDGTVVAGGASGDLTIAVGAVAWADVPIEWLAVTARRGPDLLGIYEEMEPVGHRPFDERFAVDADDPTAVRRFLKTSLREWLLDLDDDVGPLTIVLAGPEPFVGRRATDYVDPVAQPALYVARPIEDDVGLADTLEVAAAVAERVGAR